MKDTGEGVFIKILSKKRAISFLEGHIYFNTESYFAELDKSDRVRSDSDEGVDECWQIQELAIQCLKTGEFLPVGGITGPLKYRKATQGIDNILCIYVLLKDEGFVVDPRVMEFGDVAIIIRDPIEFTKRIHDAAAEKGLRVKQKPIEYIDKDSYHGAMGSFRKFDEYQYQSELRYLLHPGVGEPIILNLGSLKDICYAIHSEDIAKLKSRVVSSVI